MVRGEKGKRGRKGKSNIRNKILKIKTKREEKKSRS